MKIAYSHHAQERMAQRGISRDDVEAVLDVPEVTASTSSPPGFAPRTNYWKTVNGRRLRVTLAHEEMPVVVTVVEERD